MKANEVKDMDKYEEIIEVCGKKVVVRYARTQEDACASCAFSSRKECHDLDCNMRDIVGESVGMYAYFVEAEQPAPADVQEAAEKYEEKATEIAERNSSPFEEELNGPAPTYSDASIAGAEWQRERLASCPTFKGWVARDKCGELYFFKEKPIRGKTTWNTEDFCAFMPFPQRNLRSLRWQDEPRYVEIIIKEVGK